MDEKRQSGEPQVDVQKLSDDAVKDVNSEWGPITNRFFDQLLSGGPRRRKMLGTHLARSKNDGLYSGGL